LCDYLSTQNAKSLEGKELLTEFEKALRVASGTIFSLETQLDKATFTAARFK